MTHLVRWFVLSCVLVVLLIILVLLQGHAMAGDPLPSTVYPSLGPTVIRPIEEMAIVTLTNGSQTTILQIRGWSLVVFAGRSAWEDLVTGLPA